MASCHNRFTLPNAKASLPHAEKENAFCYNHRLIWLLKYLLLSPTGMKTYNPVSLHTHTLGNFHASIVQKRRGKTQTCHRAALARGVLSDSDCPTVCEFTASLLLSA